MSAVLFSTVEPPPRPRPGKRLRGGRVAAYVLAAAAHAGVLLLISHQAAQTPEGGSAPVVNLTLEPSPRFDSETPPAAESSAAEAAQQAQARPQPVTAPLRLRETTSTLPSPVSLPLPVRLAEPTPQTPELRQTGEQQGAAHSSGGAGAGPSSAEASVAGATQGGGGRTLGGAAAADTDVYFARVLAWIERHKRHPGNAQGVVTVSFRVDRRGRVSSLRLVRSSGVRALDRSALDQITSTQPFPRPDAGAQWATREFTVNIDYRTRPGG